jgi:hypothetical protein
MFDPFGFRLDLWRPLVLVPQPFWHGFGLDGGLVWDPETMWNLILFNTLMGVKYVDPHLGGLPTSSLQKKPGVAARGGTYFASLRMMRKGICFRSGLGITLICLVVHSPQSFFVGILYIIYIYIYIYIHLFDCLLQIPAFGRSICTYLGISKHVNNKPCMYRVLPAQDCTGYGK